MAAHNILMQIETQRVHGTLHQTQHFMHTGKPTPRAANNIFHMQTGGLRTQKNNQHNFLLRIQKQILYTKTQNTTGVVFGALEKP